jgi:putative MFS transporter
LSGPTLAEKPRETGLIGAVGAAIDAAHTPRTRYSAPILLGLVMLFDSWDVSCIAYIMPSLVKEWGLKPITIGSIISAGYAGQFVGAILLGALAEKFGRFRILYPAIILMALLSLACASVTGVQSLMVARFAQGIMIGGALPLSATYINEIAPTQNRGRYFGLFQTIGIFGYTCASFASLVVIPWGGWRWMFGLGALPLLAVPFMPFFLPESPRWLARSGNLASINKALARLGGKPLDASFAGMNSGHVTTQKIPVAALFTGDYRARTIVVVALWFTTTFISLGLTGWVPTIYTSVYHYPIQDALHFTAIFSILYILGMPLTFFLIDWFGRRRPAIVMMGVSAIALTILGLTPQPPTLLLVSMVIVGHWTCGQVTVILWPYSAEIYPTRMRALAVGFVSSFARGASMITPMIVGLVIAETGSIKPMFLVFGVSAAIGFLLWLKASRETAGVSLDDIK